MEVESSQDYSQIIERECLSVLHKLHDQVNGLQLVQAVIQPLAKLFNPASSFGQTGHGPHSANISGSSSVSSTSTYMMSPDTAQALIARLDTDRDVNWLMEIIGYGLSMPFSLTGEHDSVKDCCTIYCEWLASALLPYDGNNDDSKYQQLSRMVPVPIRKDPNRYARKMLSHLYNVFLPRQTLAQGPTSKTSNHQKDESDAILTAVSRQAVLCHRVLRTIESIAHNQANLMEVETWQHLLALLLTVNDKLLSPPTEPDGIGTQLHDRVLGVLFDIMLLASSIPIPNSNLWRTFHEMCLNWRHGPALVDHWRRITSLLTKRVVTLPKMKNENQQSKKQQQSNSTERISSTNPIDNAISSMSFETLSQTWYRFLNLIGNPVELSDPSIISRTEEFYQAACIANSVLDPRQHPCLNVLPQIFLNSMYGLSEFVDLFILNNNQQTYQTSQQAQPSSLASGRSNPLHSNEQQTNHILSSMQIQLNLNSDRPKCNSLLHIFGDWLFGAALIGSELTQEAESCDGSNDIQAQQPSSTDMGDQAESTNSYASSSATATESGFPGLAYSPLFSRRQSHQSTTSSHTSLSTSARNRRHSKQLEPGMSPLEKITLEPPLTAESFELGQAEAMTTLCKIFASKSPDEIILPNYLARFYLCLQHCIQFGTGSDPRQPDQQTGPIKRQLLASVLNSSTILLQRDLDGINLLIPSFIKAIETVFECSEKDTPIQPPPRQHHNNRSGSIRQQAGPQQAGNLNGLELKRASIMTLVNLLAYPLHFQDLAIRNCLDGASPITTFASLRPRLLKLLFMALQTEKDVSNMQILFGGLSMAIHDLASNQIGGNNKSNNLATRNSPSARHSDNEQNSLELTSSGNATTSNTKQASDTISQSSFVFDSNDGFLTKSLHVVCHLLVNIWKQDNLISLAALEVLTTIGRVSTYLDSNNSKGNNQERDNKMASSKTATSAIEMKSEYMQTTKWICDYICNQCSRPPPAHSRDMHSTIVAAYQCLSVWIYNHPYLLQDNQCVYTLLEVIELGVSGQKSRVSSMNPMGITAHTIISKSDKQLKPSSMRVREAAESLLNICMNRTCHDGFRNISSCDTVINELDIVEIFSGGGSANNSMISMMGNASRHDYASRWLDSYRSFKYFSDDDAIIFALFESSGHNLASQHQRQQQQQQQQQSSPSQQHTQHSDYSSKDSVICLLRTPFGRHCWKIRFNYYSEKAREKIISNKTLGLIKRPFQQQSTSNQAITDNRLFNIPKGQNKSLYFNQSARFFPASVENMQLTELDCMVTTLDEYINDVARQIDPKLKDDIDKMGKIFSHQVEAEKKVISECSVKIKRTDCEEPQQMTDLETARMIVTHLGLTGALNPLLNSEQVSEKFIDQLRQLDSQSIRTCDTVNVLYVRRGRTSPIEILESVRARHNVSVEFFEWLLELGQPVVAKEHNRWSGCTKLAAAQNQTGQSASRPSGLVPSVGQTRQQDLSVKDAVTLTRNQMLSSDHGGAMFDGDRMLLYWSDMCQELAFLVPHRPDRVNSNIVICWLENADDLANVSIDSLLCSGIPFGSQQHHHQHHQYQAPSTPTTGILQEDSAHWVAPNVDTSQHHHYQSSPQSSSTSSPNATTMASANNSTTNRAQWSNVKDSRDIVRYFIIPMKNGLFRINLISSSGRQWLALPLVDGMTVSKTMLASLLRESILNLCRRRCLDADWYQPPQVRRRLKIQEICNTFKISSRQESSDFYSSIFRSGTLN